MLSNTDNSIMIVFEGIDGSGKSTQTERLVQALQKQAINVATLKFPEYQSPSGQKIKEYLSGSLQHLDTYAIATLYADNRKATVPKMKELLCKNTVLVVDRYVASAMGHLGGTIQNTQKRQEFFEWIYTEEYEKTGIPKPTLQIFLDVSPQTSFLLRKQDTKRTGDIHENSTEHVNNAYYSYCDAIEFSCTKGDTFITIECEENNTIKTVSAIHSAVMDSIQPYVCKSI